MNYPLDIVARLRLAACRFTGNAEPFETRAADEIERLRDRVRALEGALDAAVAARTAAKPTRAEMRSAYAAIAETMAARTPQRAFADNLNDRRINLTNSIGHILTGAQGLDSKNPVVRLQAEADATQKVQAAFNGYGFSTVNVKRVCIMGGDYIAEVVVPLSHSSVEYCMAVQDLTGCSLLCVPAKTGTTTVRVDAASFDPSEWGPAAEAAILAAFKPYGTSRA